MDSRITHASRIPGRPSIGTLLDKSTTQEGARMNWMNWQPPIIGKNPKSEPSQPTKPGFDGFDASTLGQSPIIEPLEQRLNKHGISIAIDRATGAVLLIFNESGAEGAKDVATVHKPFEVTLTKAQRRELTTDLDTFERLLLRQKRTA